MAQDLEAPARARHRRLTRGAWALAAALLISIPAFYAELLDEVPTSWARLAYAAAAALVAWSAFLRRPRHGAGRFLTRAALVDAVLVAMLAASALLPSSLASNEALALRLAASALMLMRAVTAFEPLLIRGHLGVGLALAGGVLVLCGVGFWKLEPTVKTLPDGLWLAFVTASTLGYGDIVPTVTASRILAVFTVLLGFGVLSLVTATVAARWVEREERDIEHEIVHAMHREMVALRREVETLRRERDDGRGASRPVRDAADSSRAATPGSR
jgi:voltage-gated potassium channel